MSLPLPRREDEDIGTAEERRLVTPHGGRVEADRQLIQRDKARALPTALCVPPAADGVETEGRPAPLEQRRGPDDVDDPLPGLEVAEAEDPQHIRFPPASGDLRKISAVRNDMYALRAHPSLELPRDPAAEDNHALHR